MPDTLTRIRLAREERASTWETMRGLQDTADRESRDFTAEEQQTWDRADARYVELGGDDGQGGEIARLERHADRERRETGNDPREQRDRINEPGGADTDREPRQYRSYQEFVAAEGRSLPQAQPGYDRAFYELLQGGLSERSFGRLQEPARDLLERGRDGRTEERALSHVVGAEGGYAVPVTTEGRIIERADQVSPLRQLATVITTASGEQIRIPLEADIGGADWVAENTDYDESDVVFGLVPMNAYKVTTTVFVPRELLSDAVFDMEAYLIRVLGRRIGREESAAFATGAPVDVSNPGKPTGVYGRLTAGKTVAGAFSGAAVLTGDDLIDLQESVADAYQATSTFVLSRDAAKAARKLKDENGQYVWVVGLRDGETDQLLGRPVRRDEFLPAAGANATLAAYGDFAEAITIRDVAGVYVQRLNELRATKGQIGFLADHRTDIQITNADAVKRLRAAAV